MYTGEYRKVVHTSNINLMDDIFLHASSNAAVSQKCG